jgi:NADH:ubiquinone oxidoreductase subunit C
MDYSSYRKKFVETAELLTPILECISGALLEKSKFGRAEGGALPLFWIRADRLVECAAAIRAAGFDHLENLFAMQFKENLIFTYYVRKGDSLASSASVILRVSVEIVAEERVKLASVSQIWTAAPPFEREMGELFGVEIGGSEYPERYKGFPMRKSYQNPSMADGVLP